MKSKKYKLLILLFTLIITIQGKPKILCTAALIKNKFESRKQEYISCFEKLLEFGYIPYIVDSCKKTSNSFLHFYSNNVLYANTNNLLLNNKGVNEAQAILEAFKYFKFDENDLIVKLTGRYTFKNKNFLTYIENNPHIDIFVKQCTITPTNIFTGCFAMKYKYFKNMLEKIDYQQMEQNMICIETEVAKYIKEIQHKGVKIAFVESLHLSANLFFDGINMRYLDI